MPQGPKITIRQVRSISKRIALKDPVEKIAKDLKVSLSTVNRVRADYRATTYESALDRLEPDAYLADPEYKYAEIRAKGVNPQWRDAIIKAIVDARLKSTDILNETPDDPHIAFAPQEGDPQHDPSMLLAKLKGKSSSSR